MNKLRWFQKGLHIILVLMLVLSTGNGVPAFAQEATQTGELATPTPTDGSPPSPTPLPSSEPTATPTASPTSTPEIAKPSYQPFIDDGESATLGDTTEFQVPETLPSPIDQMSPTPSPNFSLTPTAIPSAKISLKSSVETRLKRHYSARERIRLKIYKSDDAKITIVVSDSNGNQEDTYVNTEDLGTSLMATLMPGPKLKPGKHTVQIFDRGTIISTQNFLWGVLAINTNKSIYLPNETATLALAVLDDQGNMACDADVTLVIRTPSGESTERKTSDNTIVVNPECSKHDVTLKPDYETTYRVGKAEQYSMELTATTTNGTQTISDSFEVRDAVPFDVERHFPTRIYPPKPYTVSFDITANEDFTGQILEAVPASFTILPLIDRPYDSVTQHTYVPDEDASFIELKPPLTDSAAITLGFGGQPTDPFVVEQYRKFGLAGHDGIDFDVPVGTPVLAADEGDIVLAGPAAYGNTIVIQHVWGKSYYGHLSTMNVEKGQRVAQGEQIALSGRSGLATGPHLHFGMKLNKNTIHNGYYGKIDPSPYLDKKTLASSFAVNEIAWSVSLKRGERMSIGYTFDAPDTSPEFYLIGPLRFEQEQVSPVPDASNPFVLGTATEASAASSRPYSSSSLVFAEARQWQIAVDAQVTIDSTIATTQNSHNGNAPTVVFTTDQIGYAFYRDAGGACVYSKTTNGGTSWGAAVTVDSQTDCIHIVVWYDQWTPGDNSGTNIHIITVDNGASDLWYNSLNTSGDSLLLGSSPVSISTDMSNSLGIGNGGNNPALTKGTNGVLYAGIHDVKTTTERSWIKKCSSSCGTGSNWTDTGSDGTPLDNFTVDQLVLMPLASGNIMAIRRDDSADDVQSKVYNGSSWDSTWTNIDTNALTNTTYDGQFGATVRKSTNNIYLVYQADNDDFVTADHDVRTAVYTSSWTSKTDVFTNSNDGTQTNLGLTRAKIAIDENNGDIYVVYTARTTIGTATTANVYWKKSTDGMTTWGTEQAALNSAADDIYGTNVNIMSNERLYVVWDPITSDRLDGNTMADLVSGPTNDQLMRHGNWFTSAGVEQSFTF